jgi:hypothetical protein
MMNKVFDQLSFLAPRVLGFSDAPVHGLDNQDNSKLLTQKPFAQLAAVS